MSLANAWRIIGVITKDFTRIRDLGDQVTYVNKAILGSPSVRKDEFKVRGREDKVSKSYNVNRSLGVVDAVGKLHEASINLTLNMPQSGVIDTDALRDMLSDVVTFVTQFDDLSSGASRVDVDPTFVSAAQFLEI